MRSLLLAAILLAPGPALLAQTVPAVDVNAMLAGLKDLKGKTTDTARNQLDQSITDFSNAASSDESATAFYIEAVRVTQFVGQQREQTVFHDWKRREGPGLKGPAIRACLRYMTISLQRAAGATDDQIFPPLLAYAQDTQEILPTIDDQDIATEPMSGNIFARWYNVEEQLSGLKKWESSPADLDGIYKKFLLPYMRKNRDVHILDYWNGKIAAETEEASNASAQFSTDRFNSYRRPQLLWHRAEDMIAIGQRDKGLSEMYSIVKNFPAHPSAGKWIDELETLLKGGPLPEPDDSDDSAASTPAPSPSPTARKFEFDRSPAGN